MFNSGQRSKINEFFTRLFKGISIQPLSNFKNEDFGG